MDGVLTHAAAVVAGLVARDLYERGKFYVRRGVNRRRPDQATLHSGWYGSTWPNDGVYVAMKCAPARRRPPRPVDFGAAVAFVTAHYPEFDPEARYSAGPEGVEFTWAGADQQARAVCSLWMRASGLLEMRLPLPFRVADDGDAEVPLERVAAEVYRFVEATARGYRPVFGRVRRVNWYVNLSGSLLLDGSNRHWRPTFTGPTPGGRARETHPGQKLGGYGGAALISRRLRENPTRVVRAVLVDFLNCTGYRDFDAAVAAAAAEPDLARRDAGDGDANGGAPLTR